MTSLKKFICTFLIAAFVVSMAVPFSVSAAETVEPGTDPAITATEPTTGALEATEPTTEALGTTEPTTAATEPTTAPDLKPESVTDLKADTTDTQVKLSWSKSDKATEYRIYRSDEGSGDKYKLLIKTKALSFTDKVAQATKYHYKVYAFNVTDTAVYFAPSTDITLMTKPQAVAKPKLSKKTDSALKLTWTAIPKATQYIISRADEKSDGKFTAFKKVGTSKTASFTDKKLSSGKIYKYKVAAQRTSGKFSTTGKAGSVKAMTKLAAPKKFVEKKTTASATKIKWSAVGGAQKYQLFRDGVKLANVKDRTYIDRKLQEGTTYKYTVRGYRKYNGKVYYGAKAKLVITTKTATPYAPQGMKGTWVEVNINTQTLKMYVDSKLYCTTPVVTGNWGNLSTTKGHHHVISKKSPARLRGSYGSSSWDTTVNYWLGFTGDGQGIHDSTWRSAYGGSIYKGNGSHGCVNTPLGAMAKVYAKAYVGMSVIVY